MTRALPLWVGLLLCSSPAFVPAVADDDARRVWMSIDNGLVTLNARNEPLQMVIEDLATLAGLRLVQHVDLDRVVSISMNEQPLPVVLEQLLADNSYQLFQRGKSEPGAVVQDTVPGSLWILAQGSDVDKAVALFFETVLMLGDLGERKEAIRELRRLATPDAVSALSFALGDEDERVRKAAVEALSRIGGDQALAAIASMSRHQDPRARGKAAEALAAAGGDSAAEYLQLALYDDDPRVRAAVLDSLGDVGDERSMQTIRQALDDPDPEVRERAIDVLDELEDDAAFRALFPPG